MLFMVFDLKKPRRSMVYSVFPAATTQYRRRMDTCRSAFKENAFIKEISAIWVLIAQWSERLTRDQKVVGLRLSFSGKQFTFKLPSCRSFHVYLKIKSLIDSEIRCFLMLIWLQRVTCVCYPGFVFTSHNATYLLVKIKSILHFNS